jgi:hypothetical protein
VEHLIANCPPQAHVGVECRVRRGDGPKKVMEE